MKILFLNLPYKIKVSRTSRWPEKTKSGTMYYPYWLAYAAGVVIEKKHEVKLIDSIAKGYSEEETINKINEFNPELIVVEFTTPTVKEDMKFLADCRANGVKGKFAVGGTHVTAMPEVVLNQCSAIDYILTNEYDFTIPELAENLENPQDVKGIVYKNNGEIIHNEARPYIENLDELPFVSKVYKEYLHVDDYFYALAQHPMIQIFSGRGCPCQCIFCSYPQTMGGRKYRTRSVNNLVDELEYISTNMPEIKEIFIEDDTFTVDKKRVVSICDEIIRRNLKINWSVNSRVDTDYEVLKKMKEAGCRLLVAGFESGNQTILNNIKKGITLKQSEEFAKNTKKLGLKVFGCFMIGLKGDTRETIEETFRFAKKINPDMVFFQQSVPFPGTEFYSWVKEEGMLKTEDYSKWLNEQGYLDCLVNYEGMDSKKIEKIRDNLMVRYYCSPTYIWNTFIKNKNKDEAKRVVRAGITYVMFRIKKLFV